MNQPITVIHHSADYDGLFSREIARKFLPEAQLIGWDYGDPKVQLPQTNGPVYVLDLSPDCVEGFTACDGLVFPEASRLIWIDHHKSAIEKWPKGIPGYRIDGVAACRLAWQWFTIMQHNAWNQTNEALQVSLPDKESFVNRKVTEPLAVRLAGEYDVFDHRDPDALPFQFGLDTYRVIPWDALLAEKGSASVLVKDTVHFGNIAMRCIEKRDADIMATRSFTAEWEGLNFLCLNTARCSSNTFKTQIRPEHDALMGFYWNGFAWTVSMYHVPHRTDLDLSLIAVKHGGGGHRGACGFKCMSMPLLRNAA